MSRSRMLLATLALVLSVGAGGCVHPEDTTPTSAQRPSPDVEVRTRLGLASVDEICDVPGDMAAAQQLLNSDASAAAYFDEQAEGRATRVLYTSREVALRRRAPVVDGSASWEACQARNDRVMAFVFSDDEPIGRFRFSSSQAASSGVAFGGFGSDTEEQFRDGYARLREAVGDRPESIMWIPDLDGEGEFYLGLGSRGAAAVFQPGELYGGMEYPAFKRRRFNAQPGEVLSPGNLVRILEEQKAHPR